MKKQIRTSKEAQIEDDLLASIYEVIEKGKGARSLGISDDEKIILKQFLKQ